MRQTRKFLWWQLQAQKILRVLDAFLISAAAGIAVAFLLGQIQPVSIRLSKGFVLALSIAGLMVVRLLAGSMVKQLSEPASFTAGSNSDLLADLPVPTSRLIEKADEIQILAGTLIEFVRRDADLRALGTAAARGAQIQIIMLDPAADILRAIAAERSSRGQASAEEVLERLRSECNFSILRLQEILPPGTVNQVLRLSSAMPHQAFSRYDDRCVLVPYIFGRGGSSPAMFFRRSARNKALCDGLSRGFADLWGSPMVRKFGDGISAETALEPRPSGGAAPP